MRILSGRWRVHCLHGSRALDVEQAKPYVGHFRTLAAISSSPFRFPFERRSVFADFAIGNAFDAGILPRLIVGNHRLPRLLDKTTPPPLFARDCRTRLDDGHRITQKRGFSPLSSLLAPV